MQRSALRFSNVVVDSPALILLKHGTKSLQSGSRQWTIQGGDAIAIAGGQSLDVSNHLSSAGLFEARWLVWDKAVVQRFEEAFPAAGRAMTGAVVLKQPSSEFLAATERAISAVCCPSDVPEPVALHRLTEVLVWLSLAGVKLSVPRALSTSAKLRGLFAGAPSEAWTISNVTARLAMSEATLRRRLSAEGTSFVDLLADVRMSLAMTLLQSTDRAVARIALDVGYESASRFAIRFRERFGFAPTAIRGHRRSGT
ncbi:helix-turn-helix transcriptional regulator [Variovorax sp. J2P1-59]|uniref:helix-turn-helix transcriptional regulator n=1 Tax=Variovorax flavidus TaxID=3053501 RepID=UPI0025775D05|nr:helix-turn-helix transcriptional regulator [Variovorax sp. J2P1-59]MDM0078569.1 helix-turn-helix transcriptional regulator [Variovorax sp. J2P1-59]